MCQQDQIYIVTIYICREKKDNKGLGIGQLLLLIL